MVKKTIDKTSQETEDTTEETSSTENSHGGVRVGAGRPKGSKNINSRQSALMLERLDFDPICQMVYEYRQIDKLLSAQVDKVDKIRKGSDAYCKLTATKAVLINNLMAYGYRKIPEKTETEVTNKAPLNIRLT